MANFRIYVCVTMLDVGGGCKARNASEVNRSDENHLDALLVQSGTFEHAEWETVQMTNILSGEVTRSLSAVFSKTNRVSGHDTGKADSRGVLRLNLGTNVVARLFLYE